jgi:hypothetical protein
MRRPRWPRLLAALVLPLAACWGSIGEPGDDGPATCGPLLTPPVRRLSHTEYRNSVRDLFPALGAAAVAAVPELAPDEQPHGFDNDAAALGASPLLIDQYAAAARQIAQAVRARAGEVLPCAAADGVSCGARYVDDLGPRAFRRPLGDPERAALLAIFQRVLAEDGFDAALEVTTQAILQAPPFLYRMESVDAAGRPSAYDVATRLSYLLWASTPDAALMAAAASDRLSTPAQIQAEVDRMLADPRALDGFMTFAHQWLGLARLDRVQKHASDGWNEELRGALQAEARAFLTEVALRRGATVRELLTTRRAFVSAETAAFYGLPAPSDPGFTEVDMPAPRRGFLMQLPFLAGYSHPDNPSPVQRGLFVLQRLMCRELGSPPAGIDMSIPTGDPLTGPTTNRQNYERATSAELCQTCHSIINPVGFAFEHFDTVGRWRDLDHGLAIDPVGAVDGVAIDGAGALVDHLAASDEVVRCVSGQLMTYAAAGTALGHDACLVADVDAAVTASGGSLRAALVAIATHPRFLGTAAGPTPSSATSPEED